MKVSQFFVKNLFKIITLIYLLTRIMPVSQSAFSSSPRKDFELSKENSSIIRSIILSHEREGCTLDMIKRDFLEHEGVKLHHKHGDNELRKIIESIDFVRSREKAGKGSEIFYYSEHPNQEHLAKMIRKQKPNVKLNKTSPRNTNSYRKSKTFYRKPKPQQNSSVEEENSSFASLKNEELTQEIESRFDDVERIIPHYHGCPLIGDDFFHTLATLDLGYPKARDPKVKSTCMNGMTIKMAQAKLEQEIESGSIVIVNLGSNDILNDKPLVTVMEDMVNFLLACNKKQIIPILTTLAPLPTFWMGNRREILTHFNRFIKVNPFNYPVIDLYPSFVNYFEKIDLHTFQPEPRNAVGCNKKILMWNKVGRKRVLQQLTDFVGQAIVDIYSYYAHCNIQILKWHSNKSDVGLGQIQRKFKM